VYLVALGQSSSRHGHCGCDKFRDADFSHCKKSSRLGAQKDATGTNWQIRRDATFDRCHYPVKSNAAHVGRSAAAEGEMKASAWATVLPIPTIIARAGLANGKFAERLAAFEAAKLTRTPA
jgi:hypothetical protein